MRKVHTLRAWCRWCRLRRRDRRLASPRVSACLPSLRPTAPVSTSAYAMPGPWPSSTPPTAIQTTRDKTFRTIRWCSIWRRRSASAPHRTLCRNRTQSCCSAGSNPWVALDSGGNFFFNRLPCRIVRVYILIENFDELGDNAVAFQRGEQASIHIDRSLGLLKRSGQGDADVGVFRFARAVDHTAHDGQLHLFHAHVAALPHGHLLAQVSLDLLRHLLEEGAGGASAAGAGGNLRREAANAHGLENLLRHANFFRAIAARRRRQRDAK